MCYPLIFCSFRTYGEVRDGTDETEVRRHDREGRGKAEIPKPLPVPRTGKGGWPFCRRGKIVMTP